MRQRVLIALALINRPSLLIADEPTTALDVTVQAEILRLIRRLAEERELAVLFISHDLGVISQLCDRVAVMYAGRVVETAPIDAIYQNPAHPYTRALLALTAHDWADRKLLEIPGDTPDMIEVPRGCAFHPRCASAQDECRENHPELARVGAKHRVECPPEIAARRGGR
jgi:oligopeptide/dipeptide ABC transporter ATP-binding protein